MGLLGRDLTTVGRGKVVALTFDGGASAAGAEPILATLGDRGVPASFFVTGRFASAYPKLTRRIATRYPLGNHTETHPDLTTLNDAAVRSELRAGAASIRAATGRDPRPYFRFPFGAVDARVIGLANRDCYVPFRWTVDSLGWKGTSGGMSAEGVRKRVVDGVRPGAIVLMHLGDHPTDRSTLDADALPGIIDDLKADGYRFVTLAHVLPDAP